MSQISPSQGHPQTSVFVHSFLLMVMIPSLSAIGATVLLLLQSQSSDGSLIGKSKLQRPPALLFGESKPGTLSSRSLGLDARATTVNQSTFQQLIDHDNPSLGTFSQRYWWSAEFWAGPGSPVVLFTPGEVAADDYTGYLGNKTITGIFGQAIGGAVVLLEHRYWGDSSPFDSLTTKNLQYLTLRNSIADLTYFAKTVDLPFDKNHSSNADSAPWVLSGGSYSGALSAWTASTAPGTFWAYHASSAPVEAVFDYYEYFVPIQEGMAQNCSRDVALVIDYVDSVLTSRNETAILELKTMFGLQGIEHNDDFADVLANGPYQWQNKQMYTGYSAFYEWCDAVEGVEAGAAVTPGPEGVGLEKALAGYAAYINSTTLPGYCASYGYWTEDWSVDCFDTYNASSPIFTDLSVSNSVDRQWNWFLCNEPFAYWQDGAPSNVSSIVSRLIDPAYWQRQCGLFFPPEGDFTYGSNRGRTVDDVNAWTSGWDIDNSTRLTWTNGEFDPWRSSGVSSESRPGGPKKSTEQAPVNVIPDGVHCYDMLAENGEANAGVQAVIDAETAQIKAWVEEFYA